MPGLAVFERLFAGARRLAALPLGFAPQSPGVDRSRRAGTAPNLSRPVRRAVVTGASGRVAALLLPWMRRTGLNSSAWTVTAAPGVPSDGPVRRADLGDAAVAERALRGADAVLHLAAASSEGTVADLLADNSLALANVLAGAVRQGVGRFVFASSMHVVGLYGRDEPLDEASPARPDSHYAASKLHGEALCRLYAEKHGLSVTCLRLGHVAATLEEAEPAFVDQPRGRRADGGDRVPARLSGVRAVPRGGRLRGLAARAEPRHRLRLSLPAAGREPSRRHLPGWRAPGATTPSRARSAARPSPPGPCRAEPPAHRSAFRPARAASKLAASPVAAAPP